jgi:tetratricopeptide (TPR) repeat protein
VTIAYGTRLGPYEVLEPIGQGGMGVVYRARDPRLERPVAIKVLTQALSGDPVSRERLRQEAKAAAALDHPYICKIFELGEEQDTVFLVMEFVAGETLQERLQKGRMGLPEVLRVSGEIAEALQEAHGRGFLHRDLKPSNIMLTPQGHVKVMDFGVAKRLVEPVADDDSAIDTPLQLTQPGMVLGTPSYMSPEQVKGQALDARSDQFAFGVILAQMMSGRHPFRRKSTAETISAVLADPVLFDPGDPPGLVRLVERLLAKDAAARFPSMTEVHAQLAALRTAPETFATAPMAAEPATRGPAPWLRAAAAAAILGLAIWTYVAARSGAPWLLAGKATVPAPASEARPSTPEAYDLYLRGLSHILRNDEKELDQAIGLLEKAAAKDPSFVPTQAYLALAYGNKSANYRANEPEWEEKGFAAAAKALALDPNAAEAHFARGVLLWRPSHGFPSREALAEFRAAFSARPDFSEAWHQHAVVLFHVGHLEAGERGIQRTLTLDPGSTIARFRLAPIHVYQQRFADALRDLDRVPREAYPAQWTFQRAWALLSLDRLDEAGQVVDGALRDNPVDQGGVLHAARAMLRSLRGDRKGAEADIAEGIRVGKDFVHFHHTAYAIGAVYASFGEFDKAQEWIENASNAGFPNYSYFETDIHLRRLREVPRFRAFLARLRQEWEKIPGES